MKKLLVALTLTISVFSFSAKSWILNIKHNRVKIIVEKILTIEDGVSILGNKRSVMEQYLKSQNYSFNNSSGSIVAYSKTIDGSTYFFTVSYKNSVVEGISWTENWDNIPEYSYKLENELGFRGVNQSDNYGVQVYDYKNVSKNLMISLIHKYNDDLDHGTIVLSYINNKTPNVSKVNPYNSSKTLSNSKYISNKLISIDVDEEATKKNVLLTVEFKTPALDKEQLRNDWPDFTLLIKYVKTNEVYKKVDIKYYKRKIDGSTIIEYYKILNVTGEYDCNVVEVRRHTKPTIIDGKSYGCSILLYHELTESSDEGRTVLLCNLAK